ncbi:MAG: RNA polymerase subunit sigma-24 [Gammaproteobacteria bacterium]|nr:RNA polymerase subunit sigma-24 [Gammaproteobacteria bacterium]|tara:strand:+ start:1036 stop:1668 length:633 start_codon:yes stop_codon:yes gene_type:complete
MEITINNLFIYSTTTDSMVNTKAEKQQNLLAEVASGDPKAFEELTKKYGNLIWSIARRYLSNQAEAEDAVQEIFLALWKSAGRFDANKGSEITFIATIARRRLIDGLRKNNKHKILQSIDDAISDDVFKQKSNLENNAELSLAIGILETLEKKDQELLSLSIYQGYSHVEIAKLLNLPLGTVKTKIRRNLMKIREKINVDIKNVTKIYHG